MTYIDGLQKLIDEAAKNNDLGVIRFLNASAQQFSGVGLAALKEYSLDSILKNSDVPLADEYLEFFDLSEKMANSYLRHVLTSSPP